MKTTFGMLSVATLSTLLLLANSVAMAKDKSETRKPGDSKTIDQKVENAEHVAYLGVSVEPLHPSLWSHLRHLFDREQGVWVAQVAESSPAEMAGLKKDDILLSYGDQKLYSPEQLAKLVRADAAGREVTLGIVRQGKSEQVKVTLGDRMVQQESSVATPIQPQWQVPEWFPHHMTPQDKNTNWDNFDSMTLKSLGDHRFKVEIQYLDKDGKMKSHTFEGTRQEIHDAISSEKDLPANEREHLFSGLNLPHRQSDMFGFRFGPNGVFWAPEDLDSAF